MTTATFGKPETGGVLFGVDPKQLEYATLLYRAIHTLETIRDHVDLEPDSIAGLFAEQSWRDLRYLLKQTGVCEKDIDIGEFYR
jgi:hypothetical protein